MGRYVRRIARSAGPSKGKERPRCGTHATYDTVFPFPWAAPELVNVAVPHLVLGQTVRSGDSTRKNGILKRRIRAEF